MNRLCALLFLPLLAGCSTATDPEEQRFYNRGWLFPHKELDGDENYVPPSKSNLPKEVHPEQYGQDPIVDDNPHPNRRPANQQYP